MDLKETSKLMREQSNRHTQYPLFIIQNFEEVVKAESCGGLMKHVSYDGENELTSEQYQAIEELQNLDPEDEVDAFMEEVADELGTDIEDLKDWDLYDFREIEFDEEYVYDDAAGVFFTEKACHDHIEANRHHYTKPRSYVISAWRNPEMVATMQMILKLTGDDIPSCYR